MISVVIPVYNGERSIRRSVESALSQPADVEVVVVDDASDDGTPAILASLADEDDRVVVVTHVENKQLFDSRRDGVAAASGDYVAFLDADDELVEGALGLLASNLEEEGDVDVLHFNCEPVFGPDADEPGKEFTRRFLRPAEGSFEGADVAHVIFRDALAPWAAWGKLVRRPVMERAYRLMRPQYLYQAEDAALMFAVAVCASSYRGLPDVYGLRYYTDSGDSYKFENICQSGRVVPIARDVLNIMGAWREHRDDFEALVSRLSRDTAYHLVRNVPLAKRADAKKLALQYWDRDVLDRAIRVESREKLRERIR